MKTATIMIPVRSCGFHFTEIEELLVHVCGGFIRGSHQGAWLEPVNGAMLVEELRSYEVTFEDEQLEQVVRLFRDVSRLVRESLYAKIQNQGHLIDGSSPPGNLLRSIQDQAMRVSADAEVVTTYYAFISHASEDKQVLVRRLAEALVQLGHSVWYDEFELTVGDSLRRSIDRGLARSRFGIVVLSPSFFAKNWPKYELDGLVAKEMSGRKVILPLWHKVLRDDIMVYSPTLADRVALSTTDFTIDQLARQLSKVLAA